MIDRELIKHAISEDLDGGVDITSMATLPADTNVSAQFVSRKDGVVAGIDMAIATLAEVGVTDASALVKDGDHVKAGTVLIKVSGNARGILLAERTALNFLGHLLLHNGYKLYLEQKPELEILAKQLRACAH